MDVIALEHEGLGFAVRAFKDIGSLCAGCRRYAFSEVSLDSHAGKTGNLNRCALLGYAVNSNSIVNVFNGERGIVFDFVNHERRRSCDNRLAGKSFNSAAVETDSGCVFADADNAIHCRDGEGSSIARDNREHCGGIAGACQNRRAFKFSSNRNRNFAKNNFSCTCCICAGNECAVCICSEDLACVCTNRVDKGDATSCLGINFDNTVSRCCHVDSICVEVIESRRVGFAGAVFSRHIVERQEFAGRRAFFVNLEQANCGADISRGLATRNNLKAFAAYSVNVANRHNAFSKVNGEVAGRSFDNLFVDNYSLIEFINHAELAAFEINHCAICLDEREFIFSINTEGFAIYRNLEYSRAAGSNRGYRRSGEFIIDSNSNAANANRSCTFCICAGNECVVCICSEDLACICTNLVDKGDAVNRVGINFDSTFSRCRYVDSIFVEVILSRRISIAGAVFSRHIVKRQECAGRRACFVNHEQAECGADISCSLTIRNNIKAFAVCNVNVANRYNAVSVVNSKIAGGIYNCRVAYVYNLFPRSSRSEFAVFEVNGINTHDRRNSGFCIVSHDSEHCISFDGEYRNAVVDNRGYRRLGEGRINSNLDAVECDRGNAFSVDVHEEPSVVVVRRVNLGCVGANRISKCNAAGFRINVNAVGSVNNFSKGLVEFNASVVTNFSVAVNAVFFLNQAEFRRRVSGIGAVNRDSDNITGIEVADSRQAAVSSNFCAYAVTFRCCNECRISRDNNIFTCVECNSAGGQSGSIGGRGDCQSRITCIIILTVNHVERVALCRLNSNRKVNRQSGIAVAEHDSINNRSFSFFCQSVGRSLNIQACKLRHAVRAKDNGITCHACRQIERAFSVDEEGILPLIIVVVNSEREVICFGIIKEFGFAVSVRPEQAGSRLPVFTRVINVAADCEFFSVFRVSVVINASNLGDIVAIDINHNDSAFSRDSRAVSRCDKFRSSLACGIKQDSTFSQHGAAVSVSNDSQARAARNKSCVVNHVSFSFIAVKQFSFNNRVEVQIKSKATDTRRVDNNVFNRNVRAFVCEVIDARLTFSQSCNGCDRLGISSVDNRLRISVQQFDTICEFHNTASHCDIRIHYKVTIRIQDVGIFVDIIARVD